MTKQIGISLVIIIGALALYLLIGFGLERLVLGVDGVLERSEFRYTFINDTDQDVRIRTTNQDSSLDFHLNISTPLPAGGEKANLYSSCLFVEDEDGNVIDSFKTNTGLKFTLGDEERAQFEFRLSEPHEECPYKKEDVGSCSIPGSHQSHPVETCP